jgi:hypothetical protein
LIFEAGDLFPLLIQLRQAFFCYQLIGFQLSVICGGHPNEMDKPHRLAENVSHKAVHSQRFYIFKQTRSTLHFLVLILVLFNFC